MGRPNLKHGGERDGRHSYCVKRQRPTRTIMLDNPEKTSELITELKAALPFEVELTPEVIESLRMGKSKLVVKPLQIVSDVSYLGDEGGIMCHIISGEASGNAIVISITHVRIHRKQLLAKPVFDYQKHRVKKLKKQGNA
jgi:hypothetical protein